MRAALDIGTNSVRLLIAKVEGHNITPVAKEVRVTRLGQGVDANARLSESAMDRTLDVLADLASKIPQDVPTTVFATSAVRDASNAKEFAQRVRDRIGVTLEILSGAREAELSFEGAVLSVQNLNLSDPVSVVDIGGGSTEIYTGLKSGVLLGGGSVQVGAVRMLERFITVHPLETRERASMEQEIERLLQPLVSRNQVLGPRSLIAVGGTATSLAAIAQGLVEYDDDRVTGYAFSLAELVDIYDRLGRLSIAERSKISSLQEGREDVIVSGAAILVKVAELMGMETIYVSAWDLLYGKLAFPVDEVG
ncbi:MAG: hypothetical protein GX971_03325 [Firmicutes bacterium]|nr:hypothetical protein [Bacillota bacterium]